MKKEKIDIGRVFGRELIGVRVGGRVRFRLPLLKLLFSALTVILLLLAARAYVGDGAPDETVGESQGEVADGGETSFEPASDTYEESDDIASSGETADVPSDTSESVAGSLQVELGAIGEDELYEALARRTELLSELRGNAPPDILILHTYGSGMDGDCSAAGAALARILETYGFRVTHTSLPFDAGGRLGASSRARDHIKDFLASYGEGGIVIDLSLDPELDGITACIGERNDRRVENLALAALIGDAVSCPFSVKMLPKRLNQDISSRMMTLAIGCIDSEGQSERLYALGAALARIIFGQGT